MNFEREQHFSKLKKQQAKIDRREFSLKMLEDGNQDEVKKLRKGVHLKSGRLRNMNGEIMDKKDKAETLAEYFAKIQWQIKFPDCLPEIPPKLPVELPINLNPFSNEEFDMVLKNFKKNKAPGEDAIPIEFWVFLATQADARQILLDFLMIAGIRSECLGNGDMH